MNKPRVVFPFTEAGLGHIMPMTSIADCFEKLYGDRVEVVRSQFFSETGNEHLLAYEKFLTDEVVKYNRHPRWGMYMSFNMAFFGSRLTVWGAVRYSGKKAYKPALEHMDELKPDLVFSTHYSTGYYATHASCKPISVLYCPDSWLSPIFQSPCDMTMISMPTGYEKALKKRRRYNKDNLKLVPFLIREEAYSITGDKKELKKSLGLDPDKFTVLLADGGYGIGKLEYMCKELIKRDLPINLVAVCGKSKEVYEEIKGLKSKGNTTFKPVGLADNMLEIVAASDVTCGKSGASLMAEPCFFGVPQIITHYASSVEREIGKYYLNEVGCAIKQFNGKKACDLIEQFVAYPALLEPYRQAALSVHGNYGAEKCARIIFGLLCKRYPELSDGTEL